MLTSFQINESVFRNDNGSGLTDIIKHQADVSGMK